MCNTVIPSWSPFHTVVIWSFFPPAAPFCLFAQQQLILKAKLLYLSPHTLTLSHEFSFFLFLLFFSLYIAASGWQRRFTRMKEILVTHPKTSRALTPLPLQPKLFQPLSSFYNDALRNRLISHPLPFLVITFIPITHFLPLLLLLFNSLLSTSPAWLKPH